MKTEKYNMPKLLYSILQELKEIKKILKKDTDADDKQVTKETKKPKGRKDNKQGGETPSLPADGVEKTEDNLSAGAPLM